MRSYCSAPAPTGTSTLSLHDALPISSGVSPLVATSTPGAPRPAPSPRSEEHTSELQSLRHLVCRLLLEKKKAIRGIALRAANHLRTEFTQAAPERARGH